MSPGEIGTSNVSLSFKTTSSDPFWCMLLLVRNAVDLQRGFTRTKPNIELWPESLHYFLSYLNFSHRVCWATPFFLYWLSWKRASRHVTPNLLRDWVIACYGSSIKTFERWKSSGLGTWLKTPRLLLYPSLFLKKIILKCGECSDTWNKSLTTQRMRVL